MKPISECTTLSELFCDRARWTKLVSAKNEKGERVFPTDPKAVCFCLTGGLTRLNHNWENSHINKDFPINEYHAAIVKAIEQVKPKSQYQEPTNLAFFNDYRETTFEDVVKVANIADNIVHNNTGLKKYLVFAWMLYNSSGGWSDFIDSFDTQEAAMKFLEKHYDRKQIVDRDTKTIIYSY